MRKKSRKISKEEEKKELMKKKIKISLEEQEKKELMKAFIKEMVEEVCFANGLGEVDTTVYVYKISFHKSKLVDFVSLYVGFGTHEKRYITFDYNSFFEKLGEAYSEQRDAEKK